MTRAVRAWAALGDDDRERLVYAMEEVVFGARIVEALDADVAELHNLTRAAHALEATPYQAFLIPEKDAGPRRAAGRCDDCGEAVTTGLTPFYDWQNRRELHLGPGCWRDRALARARGLSVTGEQLELGTEA